MDKKRILFDLDGTLLKTMDFHDSVIACLKDFNMDYTIDQVDKYIQAMHEYDDIFPFYGIINYSNHLRNVSGLNITEEFLKNYLNHPERLVPDKVDEEVIETLEYLYQKYSLAVVTNFFTKTQKARLEYLGLYGYFDGLYGGEKYKKPSPRIFEDAIHYFEKEESIMIGDNFEKDILAAETFGIDAVLVSEPKEIKKLMKRF